jgi:hypothetical protein
MKILVYTGYRTGSRSLGEWLNTELGIHYYHEPLNIHNNVSINKYPNFNIDNVNNGIIKISPRDVLNIMEVYYKFDKRIVLYRENTREHAESIIWANENESWHNTAVNKKFTSAHYTIPSEWLQLNLKKIDAVESSLVKEKQMLKLLKDCLILTYEELYYSEVGINKLEQYLGFESKTKFNSINKLRNGIINKKLI